MKKLLVALLAAVLMLSVMLLPALAETAEDAAEAVEQAVEEVVEDAGEAAGEAVEAAEEAAGEIVETAEDAAEAVAEEAEAVEEEAEEEVSSWASTVFEDFGKTKWYVYALIAVLAVLGVVGIAALGGRRAPGARMSARVMAEGAMMIALATVLSMIKIWEMPFGGSVTLFSMLPIVLMSYRHGTKWGLLTAFVHSLLQLIMGIKNVGYCATLGAQIACILLDYVFAFSALGLANAFSKPFRNRALGICAGTACVCVLRFVCHFLSGIFLWGSYKEYYDWAANMPTWLYSLVYNGNYMLPELIITVAGAVLLVRGAKRLFDRQMA